MKIWIRLHKIFHHKATNFSSVVWEWETDVDKIVVDCRGAGRVTKTRIFLISNITHWGLVRFYFIHFMGIERIYFFLLSGWFERYDFEVKRLFWNQVCSGNYVFDNNLSFLLILDILSKEKFSKIILRINNLFGSACVEFKIEDRGKYVHGSCGCPT